MEGKKIIGAAASGLLLLSPAAVAVASTVSDVPSEATPSQYVERADLAQSDVVNVKEVLGEFSYDQAVVTANDKIASIFAKAASAICGTNAIADDQDGSSSGTIEVSTSGVPVMSATVSEISEEEGSDSYTIGCACATNGPGGGAIVNANVSGVSVASLASIAGA